MVTMFLLAQIAIGHAYWVEAYWNPHEPVWELLAVLPLFWLLGPQITVARRASVKRGH